jgi:uncharacterized protein (DUF934 family)
MSGNVANRAIKAKPKASSDRIKSDIHNDKVIVNKAVEKNTMQHLAESDDLQMTQLPTGDISVPLSFWNENRQALIARGGKIAVQIAVDETPDDLAEDLSSIDMIVLPFVNFVDGRPYSHAHKLRARYGFTGEIRAVGDVNFDQLDFLSRAGCNAFELREDADYTVALRAFGEFTEVYQPATDGRQLIFSRRRKIH